MATRVAQTWFAAVLRKSRGLGLHGFSFALSKVNILSQRMYRGGAGTVIETGPKDVIVEVRGYPIASSRYFRGSYTSYCKACAAMFCKVAFVNPIRPRTPHPHAIAMAFSWV